MDHFKLFIGGEFVEGAAGKRADTIDPGTGLPIATVAVGGREDAAAAVEAARRAFDSGVWSYLTPEDRAEILCEYADRLQAEAGRIATIEALDSGGLLRRTGADIFQGAQLIRNLARYAAREFPWNEPVPCSGNPFLSSRNYVRRVPVGVCAAIVPWNFPFVLANWKFAMALATGNTLVLKPASDTPLSALLMAEVADRSRIPKGVFNVVTGPGSAVGEALCRDSRVDKIAFTGSTEVGRKIAALAAESVKRVTLELGGKSAALVLEDARIEEAVDYALLASFLHSGQICESGTRLLLPESLHDAFVERLVARAQAIAVGYQLMPATQMGPLVSERQLRTVEEYAALGKTEGAELKCGGERALVPGFDRGFYFRPTIFSEVDNSMRIAREEIFGPVLSVIRTRGEDEAIAIANDSPYGLGGGVFSRDIARAERVASRIRTGTVWINDYHVFSDFCPFGGFKQSGVGRELGHHGLESYTEVQHIHVGATGQAANHPIARMLLRYSDRPRTFQYQGPTRLRSGPGEIACLSAEVPALGGSRALLVTDRGIRAAGLIEPVAQALGGFLAGIFDEVPQDSSLECVDRAVLQARSLGADLVVSLGGGSAIDTAKAACLVLANGGKAIESVGVGTLRRPAVPHIVIPTTAGTGSEVTNVAVIVDPTISQKVYFVDDRNVPGLAILDPETILGLPAPLTASTGMDALTHAIESAVSRAHNPVTDGLALQAVRLIAENLPRCVQDGSNVKARMAMQIAATMAGWAFNVAGTGLVHAMAHALGARHGIPHGTANGILLPHVMRYNLERCLNQMARVAEALAMTGPDPEGRARRAPEAVEQLLKNIQHPQRLSEVGVPKDGLGACAELALVDIAGLQNPRLASNPAEIEELYLLAW